MGAAGRATLSVYQNNVSDLISQMLDPNTGLLVFQNVARTRTRGAELGYEQSWPGGMRLRGSYSLQRSTDLDSGQTLLNSPRHLAKLNVTTPLWRDDVRLGLEAQYVGSRLAQAGRAGGFWLANATLLATRLAPGLEMSASVYNLFDRRYADPAGPELAQAVIRQDGRAFRLKFTQTFR